MTGDGGLKKMAKTDEEFEELAQRVSQEASRIDCSPEEYRDGLRTIIDTLKADLRASGETSG